MTRNQITILALIIIATSIAALLVNSSIASQTEKNQSYQTGYSEGVKDGVGHGFNIRDPTYQEMLNFLATDQTNLNQADPNNYTCQNFAGDVINNAYKIGIRAGYVWLEFPQTAHGLICFQTVDKGLVYVEPQNDQVVSLVVGSHYWDHSEYEINFDDTVMRFGIIW
jgi:hypothetical protein